MDSMDVLDKLYELKDKSHGLPSDDKAFVLARIAAYENGTSRLNQQDTVRIESLHRNARGVRKVCAHQLLDQVLEIGGLTEEYECAGCNSRF
jgi:hypothetical protein